MKPAVAALTLASCAALLLGGCSSTSGPDESDGYLDPTSPDNVQANFVRSYGEMNLDEYLACLSSDFKFYFTEEDQAEYPELPPWWYKSDEQQVHENMFDPTGLVTEVALTLETTHAETIPGPDPRSAVDDVIVHTVDFTLIVTIADELIWLATGQQEFRFRTTTAGRDGRVAWEIFEWHDMEEYAHSGTSREEAGWGGIKFVFLDYLTHPTRRATPQAVIDQLESSYVAMDLNGYLDCLSADFVFYPNADDVSPEIPECWYFDTEQTVHTHMFSPAPPDPQLEVESIELQLTNTSVEEIPGPDPQDPYDDVEVHTESVLLYVNLYSGLTLLADGTAEFHLRADPDEVGPYGDLMWEIFEWYDLAEPVAEPRADRVEDTSWSGIKALYR